MIHTITIIAGTYKPEHCGVAHYTARLRDARQLAKTAPKVHRNGTSRLLRRPTSCSPCYAFTCPYQLECLDISIEEVAAAGLELIV